MGGVSGLVWDEGFINYNLGPFHPLRPIRVKLTYELAKEKGVLEQDSVKLIHPTTASRDQILLFHEDAYIRLVENYSKKGSGLLDAGDTPAFKGCYEATALVVGASIAGADAIMSGTYSHAFNPSGGLHHAHPERASGFCIFNDPAVVINYLKSKYNVKRLVYLDIDAHHGDGVMYGFYDDPAVLDIDFHESGHYLFPGTGFPDEIGKGDAAGLKLNIPLPPATGDEAYLEGFQKVVPAVLREYKPEIILVQCGADGHQDDRLAHLRMTTNMYSEVIGTVHQLAHELCKGRLLLFGGGGYTLANVPRVWTVAFSTLAAVKLNNQIPPEWAAQFEQETQEDAPTQLLDSPTTDAGSTRKQVEKVVDDLRENLARSPSRLRIPRR